MKITNELKKAIELFNRGYCNGHISINGVIMECDMIMIDSSYIYVYSYGHLVGKILKVLIDSLIIYGYKPLFEDTTEWFKELYSNI